VIIEQDGAQHAALGVEILRQGPLKSGFGSHSIRSLFALDRFAQNAFTSKRSFEVAIRVVRASRQTQSSDCGERCQRGQGALRLDRCGKSCVVCKTRALAERSGKPARNIGKDSSDFPSETQTNVAGNRPWSSPTKHT
jgi:hypothetical protein